MHSGSGRSDLKGYSRLHGTDQEARALMSLHPRRVPRTAPGCRSCIFHGAAAQRRIKWVRSFRPIVMTSVHRPNHEAPHGESYLDLASSAWPVHLWMAKISGHRLEAWLKYVTSRTKFHWNHRLGLEDTAWRSGYAGDLQASNESCVIFSRPAAVAWRRTRQYYFTASVPDGLSPGVNISPTYAPTPSLAISVCRRILVGHDARLSGLLAVAWQEKKLGCRICALYNILLVV